MGPKWQLVLKRYWIKSTWIKYYLDDHNIKNNSDGLMVQLKDIKHKGFDYKETCELPEFYVMLL